MNRRIAISLLVLLMFFSLGAALLFILRSGMTPAAPTTQPMCVSIQRGLDFLESRYNPAIGLLNESPVVASHKYWLTTDNALAAYAFERLSKHGMSETLRESMRRYGHDSNGMIEVLWGVPVSWPPSVERQVMLFSIEENDQGHLGEIWQEFHDTEKRFLDWQEYSNLGFLGALNEYNQGHSERASEIFAKTLQQFDGTGFHDKAYRTHYETYKLALALYVGATIHAPIPSGARLESALQANQTSDGGFTTLYRDLQTPEGDANTETTSLALLALGAYGCK